MLNSSCKLAQHVYREFYQHMLKLEYWMQAQDLGGLTPSAKLEGKRQSFYYVILAGTTS